MVSAWLMIYQSIEMEELHAAKPQIPPPGRSQRLILTALFTLGVTTAGIATGPAEIAHAMHY
jgi:hypothetical protein